MQISLSSTFPRKPKIKKELPSDLHSSISNEIIAEPRIHISHSEGRSVPRSDSFNANRTILIVHIIKEILPRYSYLNSTDFSNAKDKTNANLWSQLSNLLSKAGPEQEDAIQELIAGKYFKASYGTGAIYKICGFEKGSSALDPFPLKTYKNYFHYFTSKYKAVVNFPFQLLVYSYSHHHSENREENAKKVFLLPELLIPVDLPEKSESSKPTTLSESLSKFYRTKKIVKVLKKKSIVYDISKTESEDTHQRIEIDLSASLQGIRLNPPKLLSGGSSFLYPNSGHGKFFMHDFVVGEKRLANWVLVFDRSFEDLTKPSIKNLYYQAVQDLIKTGADLHIEVEFPLLIYCMRKKMSAKELVAKLEKKHQVRKFSMILFLVHKKFAKEIYLPFKNYFNSVGCPTQFWASYHHKNSFSVAEQVLTQMLAKTGKCLWKVENPLGSGPFGQNSVVMGLEAFQVCGQSTVSFNGSIDKDMTYFYSNIRYFKTEGSSNFNENISECVLEVLFRFNQGKTLPQNLFIFEFNTQNRNVSDSYEKQISKIKDAIVGAVGARPKMAFIIVDRVIDQEFVQAIVQNYARPFNGVAILNDFVSKSNFDFYLLSNERVQEDPKITHFNVVLNETDFDTELVRLSFFQTFAYYNHQGSIELPAVIKNAKKQASFCKRVRIVPSEELKSKMYFL